MEEFWIGFHAAAEVVAVGLGYFLQVAAGVIVYGVYIAMFFGLSLVRFCLMQSKVLKWAYCVFLVMKWGIVVMWTGLGICVMNGLLNEVSVSCVIMILTTVVYIVAGLVYFTWQKGARIVANGKTFHALVESWLEIISRCWREELPS